MPKSFRERINDLLMTLREPIAEYGIDRFKGKYGTDWKREAITFIDEKAKDKLPDGPAEWEIALWMGVYLGAWKEVFSSSLSNSDRSVLFELKDVRNAWAHQDSFDFDRTYRAHDSAEIFLRAINSPVADAVHERKEELQRERYSKPPKRVIAKIKINPQANLKAWREVAIPHEDVQKGTYSQAEFAADLWEVYKAATGVPGAKARPEYAHPKEFFGRTYLTQGLSTLLEVSLKRLSGAGGEPVIQLQTNFGGGKTHSLLALFHLASGISTADLPGIDDFVRDHSLSIPAGICRAVIVGNKIQPSVVKRKPDGTQIHTLWGEIAYQLGGKVGYNMVRSADESSTNPGDAFTELLRRFAPAVILIDEWVAYARQLFDRTDILPAGSFDTQFTFAQTLTESVRAADRTVLVLSLPQSLDEQGSEGGEEALIRLQTVVGRLESTWQPATQDEAYEIVRRRLFDAEMDTRSRGGVVQAYAGLYASSAADFPSHTRDKAYVERLTRTYPVHPDLFDYLYRNWSTIPRFQQTRGVLRLMASVIHSLWIDEDRSLMIMPGSVPLDDPMVRTEFTKFLGTAWNNIIESEIDGENCVAQNADRENVAMGRVAAGRRIARALFLATSPMEKASRHGIDSRAVRLGTVQPGEKPAVFADAITHVAKASVYLYSENERYWYSERPTLRKLAEDRKSQLWDEPREIMDALIKRLEKSPKIKEKADFARVHIAPKSASDVADTQNVGLVVISPEEPHTGTDTKSDAMVLAKALLDSRGTGPRINKNALVFAAADQTRLRALMDAVASWLAWSAIIYDAEIRGTIEVTTGQLNSARAERDQLVGIIEDRIPETYKWLFVPTQKSARDPIEILEHSVNGQQPIALKVNAILSKNDWLLSVMDGPRLRYEIDEVPLWKNDIVEVSNLFEYFARYVYLPRVASPDVIRGAILEGLGRLTWETETFALASSYDADAGQFAGLIYQQTLLSRNIDNCILVHPEIAQEQIRAQRNPPVDIGDDKGREAGVAKPGKGDKVTGHPVPPPRPKRTRFFGSINLDPMTPSSKMGVILEEVLVHLTGAGADVRLHLEVQAHKADGFSETVVNTVTENAATLQFEVKEFEEE